jgi:hypothetical protein
MTEEQTDEQKDRCPEIVFLNSEPAQWLRCEKPAGHCGVHEAEGIEWWDSK